MISFIWPRSANNFLSGIGGSESYTIGQTRELNARGIDAQVVTLKSDDDGDLPQIPRVPFLPLSKEETAKLEIPIFVLEPQLLKTRHPSYVILHCPPPPLERGEHDFYVKGVEGRKVIVSSQYAAQLWADDLGIRRSEIGVAYPFADSVFAKQPRQKKSSKKKRVLLASRLHPDKGIYTFLAALHFTYILPPDEFEFDVVMAATDTPEGKIIEPMLKVHPYLNLLPPAVGPGEVAKMMARYDIVLMPSNAQFYHETFGMNSVEAQHAGCRVVASRDGGLVETDCGGVTFVEPDNPYELARGIATAAGLPPLTDEQRRRASTMYTVKQSVDQLLNILK
ncbi:MAG TPA: glycosyltransferase family 4 protein [Candidatus Saccharimonadales bacterium]|nr:glycosyltransferase family 4 protein [Candidatus Saccharimonadales bacterium]